MTGIWNLFFTFVKIGLLSIGGGYAVIPMIREQVVNQAGWISTETFTDIITISQMTPGPLAVNTSTFVGLQIHGLFGAIAATIGCVLGGALISLGLYRFFSRHQDSTFVLEILNGLKAASLGLIVSAAASICLLTYFENSEAISLTTMNWPAIAVSAVILLILRKWKFNPVLIMIACGIIGFFLYQ